jgi:hypothetical protein
MPAVKSFDRCHQFFLALIRRAAASAALAFAALAAGAIRRLGTSESLVPLV